MNSFDNSYVLRHEIAGDGVIHYYVCYIDGQTSTFEIEIDKVFYDIYLNSIHECKRHRNFFDRHIEHSELSEEAIHSRAIHSFPSVEDIVQRREWHNRLREMVDSLPSTQRRRFILYYEYGLTYEQIAKIENCTYPAIIQSVEIAHKKILKKFSD